MAENQSEEIDFRDYLRVILKRRWTIITIFAVIVIVVTIHAFTATPIYEATTRLIIEKENPNVISFQEVMAVNASGTDFYQTQYKIIESRSVAREVVRRLNQNEIEVFFPKPKDDLISNLIASIKEIFKSKKDAVVSLLKTDNDAEQFQDSDIDYELLSGFIGRISVKPVRRSRLVDLKFQAEDPVLAAKIVHTLAKAYIDQSMETKLNAVQNAVKWLHNRIELEREKVGKAEEALIKYKEKHNIITDFTSDLENITAQKLAQLNTHVVEAESKRVEAEMRYKQSKALEGTPDMLDSVPDVLKNELIIQIKGMEVELYKRMSELSKKYGSRHPKMIAVQSELKTLKQRKSQEINRVINSLKNEYKVSLAKEESLKESLAKQKQESLDLNQKAIEYGVLRREAESAREMYELLIKRFKETSMTEDMRTGNVRIVDKAEVPQKPVKPRKKLNILLAVIVGLFLGTGTAFILEFIDNTIKIPEDIKRYLNIPYLGPVPVFAMDGNPDEKINRELVTLHSPKSTASESYRGIRTGILFSSAESEPQAIMVASACSLEGKTTTTANLAITMAQSGGKVVILDCDLRRPKLHKIFGITRGKGITNLLLGKKDIKDSIYRTRIPNLYVIPSGPVPPNPSEMLGSRRMKELIEVLRKGFARIIIDSPPICAVTDAVVLAKSVDGVVFVIRANDSARDIAKNGVDQLQAVGAHMLGAVLNGVELGMDSYYYRYLYYYYGEDNLKKKKPRKRKSSISPYHEEA
jgi:capsular exopolysaccharide synthesis family protein